MRIGLHDWEPGLSSEAGKKASSGGAMWKWSIIHFLTSLGHEVYWLGIGVPFGVPTASLDIVPELDVVVCFWRWVMHPQYADRNEAYKMQWKILQSARENRVKIMIYDLDHKISVEDLGWLANVGAKMYAPELFPSVHFEKLLMPNPYDLKSPLHGFGRPPFTTETDLVYIGNNYERWEQFVQYVAPLPDHGMKVKVYGNWLEVGPGRQDPELVKMTAPGIQFCGRIPNDEVIDTLRQADATVQLAKDSYCRTGFITMRWIEAAAAGVMSFIPQEFQHTPEPYRNFVIVDARDLCVAWFSMDEQGWMEAIDEQQQWVKDNCTFEAWKKVFEEMK